MKTKSCENQLTKKSLFIDFLNVQKILTIKNIDMIENLYFYIEFSINSIFEKSKKSFTFKSLLLLSACKKSDYMNNAFIKSYLNHPDKNHKKTLHDNFNSMFIDNDNNIRNISLRNYQFCKHDFEKLFQSQFTTLKTLVNYFYVSMLSYKSALIEIKSQTSKTKSKKS